MKPFWISPFFRSLRTGILEACAPTLRRAHQYIREMMNVHTAVKGRVVAPDLQNVGWLPEQSGTLNPTTNRLLHGAGVVDGMSVLVIRCGSGDVALVAADLVGPEGRVVGIDPSESAIGRARSRAVAGSFQNIDFRCADLLDENLSESFDVVVCRHVVIGQRDPAGFLRSASRLVRSGGVLAMHEMDMSRGIRSSPPLPELRAVNQIIHDSLKRCGVLPDAGGRLVALLDEADLHQPQLFSESVVGTGDHRPVLALVVAVLRSLMPHLTPTEKAVIDIDGLEQQLRQSALMLRSQVEFIPQVCAWVLPVR